jgi:uncharacterized membrane protein YgdD (TMEM256/DUF423 family)
MGQNKWITIGAFFCLIAVATGAFGAHALKAHLTPYHLEIWNKAVMYQFIHGLALCFTGILSMNDEQSILSKAGWLFTIGIVCFSGSLYLLSTKDLVEINVKWAGPVTPMGGMCFIAGWLMLLLNGIKTKKDK